MDHDEAFPRSNNNSNHTSGVLLLSQIECLNAELKVSSHYEVFREIGKDMHGQSAGPSCALSKQEEGCGGAREEMGWMGGKGKVGGGGTTTFGLELSSLNNRTIFGMFELHDLHWRMHRGVIEIKEKNRNKKKKNFLLVLFFFISSGPFGG